MQAMLLMTPHHWHPSVGGLGIGDASSGVDAGATASEPPAPAADANTRQIEIPDADQRRADAVAVHTFSKSGQGQEGATSAETDPDPDPQDAQRDDQNAAPRPPTLFLLDEFASLGRLSAVERAMGLMAGYGVQLWPILQDLSQLKVLYGESANTFMANSGVVQTFGVNDYETAKWLSLLLGQQTRYFQTSDHMGESEKNVHARDLLTPDEIMLLDPSLQILKIQNMRPVVAKKIVYYSDPRFDPNWVEPEVPEFEVQPHDPQNPQFTRQAKRHERKR